MATNVFEMFAKLSLDSSAFQKSLDGVKAAMKGVSDVTGALVKGTIGMVGDLAKKGIQAATDGLTGFIKSSIDTTTTFEQAIAGVSATLGRGSEQVIGELRDFAMKMGESTQYTATEAANALNYMALAGYDAAQSMEMLPNVLNLAAAGGIELATASDMVTDAQSALQLSFDDTGAMVDQMAMAASKSNTSIAQLGDAILTVGGTAKNLKGGTAELATVLGILADNGIKGSEGGTALRNMLNSLTKPTGEAAELLDSMGVSLYDDSGAIKSLNDVFGDLKRNLDGMTDQQRGNVIATVFNARDMKSAEALLNGVGDRFNSLMTDIQNAEGSAEEMRKKQEDTLQGQTTIMQSAIEGLKISVGQGITPALKDMATLGADAFSMMNKAYKNNGLTGLFNELERWIPRVFEKISTFIPRITDTVNRGLKLLAENLPGLFQDLLPQVLDGISSFADMMTKPEALETFIDAGATLIQTIANGILNSWAKLADIAARIVTALANYLESNAGEFVDTAVSMITGFVNSLTEGNALKKIIDGAIRIVSALADALTRGDTLQQLFGATAQLIGYLFDTVTDPATIREITNLASGILNGLMNALLSQDSLNKFFDPESGIPKLLSNIVENIGTIASEMVTFAGNVLQALLEYFTNPENWDTMKEGATNILVKLGEAFNAVTSAMDDAIFALMKTLATAMGAKFDGTEAGKEIAEKLISAIWENFKQNAFWIPGKIGEYLAGDGDTEEPEINVQPGQTIAEAMHDRNKALLEYNRMQRDGAPTSVLEAFRQAHGLATGGIVTRPTYSLIGEAGAEAIVPLENNTGWIDKISERLARSRIESPVFNIEISGVTLSDGYDTEVMINDIVGIISEKLRMLQVNEGRATGATGWR